MNLRRCAALLAAPLLFATACASVSVAEEAPVFDASSTSSVADQAAATSEPATSEPVPEPTVQVPTALPSTPEPAPTITPVPEPLVGAATWALIDGVPAYRKNGVLIKSGLVYSPVLDSDGRQTSASLIVEAEQAALVIVLDRFGQVGFDQMQFKRPVGLSDSIDLSPFVVTGDDQVFIFSEETDSTRCEQWAATTPLSTYGIVDHFDQSFDDLSPTCLPLDRGSSPAERIGNLPKAHDHAIAFGILIDSDPLPPESSPGEDAADDSTDDESAVELVFSSIELEWLALAHSTAEVGDSLLVQSVGLDASIAARTDDPADDSALREIHVHEFGTGVDHTIAESAAGEFLIDLTTLGTNIVRISMDNYGQQMYPYQGAWLDLDRLRGPLTIDFSPEFEIAPGPPPESELNRKAHRLSIWNGSTTDMEFHEFRGITYTNNQRNADRDRTRENPNSCRRIALLGGSWIEAKQTRIDQKPGVIAEAILDSRLPGCHEVITIGRNSYSAENHYQFAKDLVEQFGVELLIFGISKHNLCRMDDDNFIERWEVALETPLRWRLINGEMVKPFTRRDATPVEPDPNRVDDCDFLEQPPVPGSTELALIQKSADLEEIYSQLGAGVTVRYLNIRDVYGDSPEIALQIQAMCEQIDLRCTPVPPPSVTLKPEGIGEHSPFLFRYRDDDHPTARTNQRLARDLATFIEQALADG